MESMSGEEDILPSHEEQRSTDEPPFQHDVHICVQCDGCKMYPLVGERYKCYECDDYDLCGTCKAERVHPHHSMEWMLSDAVQTLKKAIKRGDLNKVKSCVRRWPALKRWVQDTQN